MPCSASRKTSAREAPKHRTHRGDIAILFILVATSRYGQEENDDPRNTNFSPHLQVNRADTGVQTSTHKNVINEVPRHADLVPSSDRNKVRPERHGETVNHGDGHDMTIVVNDFGETENVVVV